MAVSYNIHIGLPAWAASTAYNVGNRVSKSSNAYQCVTAGTSSTSGPSGTGSTIADGGVTWKWLSAIDYTSLQSAATALPSSFTQPITWLLWNDSEITTTTGTAFLSLSGHTTTTTNNLTIKCAPGESIRDAMALGSTALTYQTNKGVGFRLPSGVGSINYFDISVANVIIDGIQIVDPYSQSNSTIVAFESGATGGALRNCILDGFAQANGWWILQIGAQVSVTNTLVVDWQGVNDGVYAVAVVGGTGTVFANNTFVSPNSSTNGSALLTGPAGSGAVSRVRNCAMFGYALPITGGNNGSTVPVDHSAFSATSLTYGGNNVTNGGNNLVGKSAANQFINPSGGGVLDLRLKTGADLIDGGVADTTDIAAANDIAGTTRPQGAAWDIGAWELVSNITGTGSASFGAEAATVAASIGQSLVAAVTFGALVAAGVAAVNANGSSRFGALTAAASTAIAETGNGSSRFGALAAQGFAAGQASGESLFGGITASSIGINGNQIVASSSLGALRATAATIFGSTANTVASFGALSTGAVLTPDLPEIQAAAPTVGALSAKNFLSEILGAGSAAQANALTNLGAAATSYVDACITAALAALAAQIGNVTGLTIPTSPMHLPTTSSTSGGGAYTFNDNRVSTTLSVGDQRHYTAIDPITHLWEVGLGTLMPDGSFQRTQVLSTSIGTATIINWSSGTRTIIITDIPTNSTNAGNSVTPSIAAAGTTSAGATLLTAGWNVVNGGSGGVRLPDNAVGSKQVLVFNQLATTLSIYPPTGKQIAPAGVDVAFTLTVAKLATFYCVSPTQWIAN